ncbi:hypothetical protein MVEN_02434600 [Mycena venus]|uniref:Uncharacterized protein n=1 Tax=Mycena venus TaxID=2733690 RepID=A0A8H6WYC6_9AGAR|nr:hypothetical protein MVEN_02434600 [Mycena venus]
MVPASRPARPPHAPLPDSQLSAARLPPTVPTLPSSAHPSKIQIRVGRRSLDVCKVSSTPAVCVHYRSCPSSTPAAASPVSCSPSPTSSAAPQEIVPESMAVPLRVSIAIQTEDPTPLTPLSAPVTPANRVSSSTQTDMASQNAPADVDPAFAPSAAHVKAMIDISALLKEKPRLRVTNTFKRVRAVQGTAGANEDLLKELKGRISAGTTPARIPAKALPPAEASPTPSPSPAMLRPCRQPQKEKDANQGSPIQELRKVLSQRKASLQETLFLTSDGSLNDKSPLPTPCRLRRPLAPVFVQNRPASDSRFPAASSPAPIKPFEALRRRFLVPELDENTRPSSNPWITLELESLRSQGKVGGGGTMEGAPRREMSLVALGIFQKNRKPKSKENEVVL